MRSAVSCLNVLYSHTQCQSGQRCRYAASQHVSHVPTSACQSVPLNDGHDPSSLRSSVRRNWAARTGRHIVAHAAHLGNTHSSTSRDLLDCWPGCSRASWIEGGPDLGGYGSAFSGGAKSIMSSAAALAEPPAESATAEPEAASAGNSVIRICAPEEFEEQLTSHGSDLIVLMCKAHSCRPCKMFARKFQRLAESYPDVTFLEIYGDDTKETRKLMISMSIRVTPNFRLYRSGELVDQFSGINETNLRNAVEKALHPESAAEDATAAS